MTADILEKGEVEDRQSSFLSEVDKVASFLKHCRARNVFKDNIRCFGQKGSKLRGQVSHFQIGGQIYKIGGHGGY